MYKENIPKKITFMKKVREELLLKEEEIKKYNQTIQHKTKAFYAIEGIQNVGKEEILKDIEAYELPTLPKYDGNKILTALNTKMILENRNIENIETQTDLLKGIIVKRSNLRAFPTEVSFYDKKGIQDFDRIQETELTINTPVKILHKSKDQLWNFVVSPIYAGWVLKENIALAKEEDWDFFIHNPAFGVITDANIKIEGDILDMGVRLPFINCLEDQYQLVVPIKTKENTVSKKIIYLSKDKVHLGYLPYTEKNILLQAFKYENTPYSWGGKDQNIDCSSFIMKVYATFGFHFPRNASAQQESIGKIIFLENMNMEEKLNLFDKNAICLLYQTGHVMMYLGKLENRHYIIHASGKEKKVTLTDITEENDLLFKIERMVLIR